MSSIQAGVFVFFGMLLVISVGTLAITACIDLTRRQRSEYNEKQKPDESHEVIVKLLKGRRLANYCDEDLLAILRSPHVNSALYNLVFKMLFDRHES